MIGKLLGLATLGSTLANVRLLHLNRFLSGITTVVALTVVSALMCTALLISGFYGAYVGLMHYGLDPVAAAFTVAAIAVVITAAFIGLTVLRFKELRDIPSQSLQRDMPGMAQVNSIANAFIEGLLSRHRARN